MRRARSRGQSGMRTEGLGGASCCHRFAMSCSDVFTSSAAALTSAPLSYAPPSSSPSLWAPHRPPTPP